MTGHLLRKWVSPYITVMPENLPYLLYLVISENTYTIGITYYKYVTSRSSIPIFYSLTPLTEGGKRWELGIGVIGGYD